jgi:hypothetical protein
MRKTQEGIKGIFCFQNLYFILGHPVITCDEDFLMVQYHFVFENPRPLSLFPQFFKESLIFCVPLSVVRFREVLT